MEASRDRRLRGADLVVGMVRRMGEVRSRR